MIAATADAGSPVDLDGTPIDPLDHGGLVGKTIRRYRRRAMDLDDLDQAGQLGLMDAYRRYDPSFGCKFCTYAVYWIRHRVRLEAFRGGHPLHLPSNVFELVGKLKGGEDPREEKRITDDTIAAVTQAYAARAVRDGDDGRLITGRLADHRERSPGDVAADRATVADLLRFLTERERDVIVGLYGLDGRPPGNFQEVGRELGFSPQRARQLANRALDKLRHAAGSDYKGSSRPWDGRKVAGTGARGRDAACLED